MKREKRNMHMKKPCGYQMKLLKGAEWRKLSRTHRINGYINRNAVIEKTENGKRGRRFHVCFGIYRIVADKSRKHIYSWKSKTKKKKNKQSVLNCSSRANKTVFFLCSIEALQMYVFVFVYMYMYVCDVGIHTRVLLFFSDSFAKFCSPHSIRGFGRTM